jgi:hypothetical protein
MAETQFGLGRDIDYMPNPELADKLARVDQMLAAGDKITYRILAAAHFAALSEERQADRRERHMVPALVTEVEDQLALEDRIAERKAQFNRDYPATFAGRQAQYEKTVAMTSAMESTSRPYVDPEPTYEEKLWATFETTPGFADTAPYVGATALYEAVQR